MPTQQSDSDCFSACLSWLLNLPQDEVPDFTDREDPDSGKFYHNVADFLNARGLRMMMIEWHAVPAWIGGPVIARGMSPRKKAHAVLWNDDGLMHDPHPSRAGLCGEPTHAMLILSHNAEPSTTPNPAYVDAPHETHCIRYDRVTGKMLTLVATSENEAREFFDHSKDYCDPES